MLCLQVVLAGKPNAREAQRWQELWREGPALLLRGRGSPGAPGLPPPPSSDSRVPTACWTKTLGQQSATGLWAMVRQGTAQAEGASFPPLAPGSSAGKFSLKSSELCSFAPESSAERVEMALSGSQQPISQKAKGQLRERMG